MDNRSRGPHTGMVLVVGLWIIAFLSILLLALITSTRVIARREAWVRTETSGRDLIQSLAKTCMQLCRADTDGEVDCLKEPWGHPGRWLSSDIFAACGVSPKVEQDWVLEIVPADEAGKVNVNEASPDLLEEVVRETAAGPDARDIVQAILDWRDQDGVGAFEEDAYSDRVPAYVPGNAPFEFVEELLFVAGVTPLVFWGEDADFNGTLDLNEDDGALYSPVDNADGRLDTGLCDLLTVYGDGTINMNTAPERVLRAVFRLCVPEADAEALAAKILTARVGKDALAGTEDDVCYSSAEEIAAAVGEEVATQLLAKGLMLGIQSQARTFTLRVTFPGEHRTMMSRMTVVANEDELVPVSWHDF